jgi:hypothetical protein
MFVATRSRGEMSAQAEAAYLARLLDLHKRTDGFTDLAAEWLLSHRHAQMLGLNQLGLFGLTIIHESRSPNTAADDDARVVAEIVPRFVLGECSETGHDHKLDRLANSALLRLIAIDPPDAGLRAHLAYKSQTSSRVLFRGSWALGSLARLGLVPASSYTGAHGYLDRLRKLDGGLKAKLVLLVSDRIGRWLAALAKLPRGTLTENPYLYCRSVTYLERLNEDARRLRPSDEQSPEEWADAYTEHPEPEYYDYPD